jgi:hypothetical protein
LSLTAQDRAPRAGRIGVVERSKWKLPTRRNTRKLTYASCQQHDKRADALRRNPELLDAILENPAAHLDGRLVLALKALRWGKD